MAESFAPGVTLPDGRVVYPTGQQWLLGFALGGCEWAEKQLYESLAPPSSTSQQTDAASESTPDDSDGDASDQRCPRESPTEKPEPQPPKQYSYYPAWDEMLW